jgi:hypothetical protein
MFSCKHCNVSDPSTDTVKVNFPTVEEQLRLEEEERRAKEAKEEEERQQREEEAARERARILQEQLEAERQRAEAEAAERQRVEAERRAEEAAARRRQEELARQQREREEAERRAEEQRQEEELRQQRQAKVAAFLKSKGFADVMAPKRSMMKTTYPIIVAAEAGDKEIVEFLIQEGADPAQKNSSGKTAIDIAAKKNKKSSHEGVLRALGGA